MTKGTYDLAKISGIFVTPLVRQILVALACTYLCMCSGLAMGYSAVLLPQLSADPTFNLDPGLAALVASITALAMGVGGICVGAASDRWGRRVGLAALTVPAVLGWVALALTSDITGVLAARVLTGLSSGALRSGSVLYLAEVTPPRRRSFMLPGPSCAAVFGIILSHATGTLTPWTTTAIFFTLLNVLAIFIAILLPESPLWLIMNGDTDRGSQLFLALRGEDDNAKEELAAAIEKQKEHSDEGLKEKWRLVCSSAFLRPAGTCFIMFLCVQWSGVNIYFFLAEEFCAKSCPGGLSPFAFMMTVDGIRLVSAIIMCVVAKVYPRKATFLCSSVAIAVACGVLAWGGEARVSVAGAIAVAVHQALGGAVIALAWSFTGEIYPSQVRGLGSAVAAFSSFFHLFLSVQLTPLLTATVSLAGLYTVFGTSAIAGAIALYFFLPDTHLKTLQQIEDEYQSDKKLENRV